MYPEPKITVPSNQETTETTEQEKTEQKQKWLQDHGIKYKQNIVPGSGLKSKYAIGSDTILVDDTDYVIDAYIKKGGIGILHRDLGNTKQLIIDALAV